MTWELERSLFSYVSVLRRINTILELRFAFVILILLSTLVFIFVLLFLSQQPSNNQRSDTLAHPMSVSSLAASRRRRVVCCRCWKTRFFEVINTLFGARPSSQVWRATGARRAVCVQVWYGDWFLRRAVSWSVCLQVSRHRVGRSDSRACLVMCSSVRSSRRAMPVSGVAIGPCAGWSVGCRCAGRSVQVGGLGHGCRRSTRVTPTRLLERRVVQAERARSVVSSAWLSFAVGRASQVARVEPDWVPA